MPSTVKQEEPGKARRNMAETISIPPQSLRVSLAGGVVDELERANPVYQVDAARALGFIDEATD